MIVSRLPLRHSKSAWRSRQLGAVSIPTMVVAVLAHRMDLITANTLVVAMAVGSAVALLAILLAGYAIVDLWREGGKGFSNAFMGMIYAAIALIPLSLAVIGSQQHPPINDISTDMVTPPALTVGATASERFSPEHQDMQKAGYPDIVPRRFRIAPHELHQASLLAVQRLGWELVTSQPPDLADEPSYLLAEVTTPVLAFKDDLAVRIQPDRVGALMDVRSASRVGSQDLGANARHIRDFFEQLDSVLLETYGVTTPSFEVEGPISDSNPLPEWQGDKNLLNDAPTSELFPVPDLKPSLN